MDSRMDDNTASVTGANRMGQTFLQKGKEDMMTPQTNGSEQNAAASEAVSRRAWLKGAAAAAGAGIATLGLAETAQAFDGPQQPEADSGHDYTMPTPHAKNGKQFGMGVMGPAALSAAASQLAVDKASDADTKQFANFELREALAVVAILKSLNVPVPPMETEAQALLAKLKSLPAGAEFDKTYIAAELANHEFLRDLAESYLKNATGNAETEERHVRHLAALALTAFKEHVVLSKNIIHTLGA